MLKGVHVKTPGEAGSECAGSASARPLARADQPP